MGRKTGHRSKTTNRGSSRQIDTKPSEESDITISTTSKSTNSIERSELSDETSSTDSSELFLLEGQSEVELKESTSLFDAILLKDWTKAQHFLETGRFTIFSFKDEKKPLAQASTWVTSRKCHEDDGEDEEADEYDDEDEEVGTLRWRQLPLHRAIINKATPSLIKLLIQIYPKALLCPDEQENLPIHLAFKYDLEDECKIALLKASPWTAMDAVNADGLTPVECLGYNKSKPANARKNIYKISMEQAASHARIKENELKEQIELVQRKVEAATTELGLAVIDLKIEKVRAKAEEEWREQNTIATRKGLNEKFSNNGLSCTFSGGNGEKSMVSKLTFFS